HIVGLLPGEASVFRTVGGRVTDAVIEQLGMVAGLAKLLAGDEAELDVALIHHTSCGASLFGDHGVQQRLAATAGTSPEKVATLAIADPVDTVRGDLDRLRDSVLPARLRVSGYVYDVATGVLEPVEDTRVLRSTA
ncbi:MAG: hypothetical protein QNJ12_12870, partial [Ilumatobacter sp.]|uniref:hypothetical protein n=1 Tax=Ilumatobacter sp. TaxID=1967498 RepID=UPI002630905C